MAEPNPMQEEWLKLGYGMLLHLGPNTVAGVAWGDGKFTAEKVVFPNLDVKQWADTAMEAGMKYALLTVKHHDGFCLWPTTHTDYSVNNSPGQVDLFGRFVEEFRNAGIKVGFYYSLWDRNYPQYEDDVVYADYMKKQLTELLTQYGDIVQIWFDGLWDKDHPTREWAFDPKWMEGADGGFGYGMRWHWQEIYDLIHELQPNCMVLNNSCSDCPGLVKYMPIDARTAEQFDFVYNEQLCVPIEDPNYTDAQGREYYLPLEYCTTITPGWFWNPNEYLFHPSVDTICSWYTRAKNAGGNLLLNIGPNADGKIPEYTRQYLREAGKRLFA